MTQRKTRIFALALAATTGASAATLQNGDFSAGLSGWSQTGDVATNPGGALLSTASVLYDDDFPAAPGAFNVSGVAAASVGAPPEIETFLGLAPGALDPDIANGIAAYEGSALGQQFIVHSASTLSFDWRLSTNDTAGADYGFVVLDGTVTLLGSSADAALAAAGFVSQTPPGSFARTLGPGTHWLAFGIVDVGDYNLTSALSVSNVSLLPVPEPAVWLQMSLGLAALAGLAGRRRVSNSNPFPPTAAQGASQNA